MGGRGPGGGRPAFGAGLMVALLTVALLVVAVLAGAAPHPAAADGNEAPGAPAGFRSITAGAHHACAVVGAGQVKCWGRNLSGQLGLGDVAFRGDGAGEMGDYLPLVPLPTGRTAVALAAGESHTCALLDDGSVRCWGENGSGQLGLGDTADRGDAPDELGDALPAVDLGPGRTATAVTAGSSHTCALLDDGSVKCWGAGTSGRLGQGDQVFRGDGPGEMGAALPPVALGAGRTAVAVTGAYNSTCALLDDGTVKCWGGNEYGQLGQGDVQRRGDGPGEMGDALAPVALGTGRTAVAVTSANLHVCALLDDGTTKCWGHNLYGQLGLGDTAARGDGAGEMGDSLAPVALGTDRTATALSAGAFHTCALLDDGSVKCWGDNSAGQLGQGDKVVRGAAAGQLGDALLPVNLGPGRQATALTLADYATCARLDDGSERCWGHNGEGELGIGAVGNRGDAPSELGSGLKAVDLGDPAGPPSGIGGRVQEATGSAVVAGTFVAALRAADLSLAGGAVTDADGTFRILLPPGSYFVYLLDATGVHGSRLYGAPTSVVVTSAALTFVDATMARVRGRLIGTVVERVTINPREAPAVPGAWAFELGTDGQAGRGATANGIGFFSFEDITVGPRYLVFVDPAGAHLPQFWYQSPGITGATQVNVAATGNTQVQGWLDPSTRPAGGAALTGTVREDGTDRALAGVRVIALRASTFALAAGTTTDADGAYALDLDPGSYRLEFVDPSGTHAMEWFDDQPFSAIGAAGAVTAPGTVDASLAARTGAIGGHVVDGTGDPRSGVWALAIAATGGIAGAAVTDAGGAYSLSALPVGSYRMTFVDPTGARPQEYWPDRASYDEASPIQVAPATTSVADATL